MKITSFNPQIMARNAEPIIQLFEELGFERRHTKTAIGELNVTGYQMRDSNGFNLDISEQGALPMEALTCIRMNVDDFEEAYQLLLSKGFKNYYGDHTANTPSSKSAVMIAPTGFVINLVKHIK
jgi:hypothetical protein